HGLRHILDGFGEREMRIPRKVAAGKNNMLNMDAVHADEPMTEVIEGLAELRFAVDDFEPQCLRVEADVGLRFEGRTFILIRRANLSTRQSAGQVHPIVWSPRRM